MRHFILIPLALVGLSAFPPGQQPPATLAQKAVQKPAEPAAVAKPQGLTVDSVLSMVQAGLSEDVIIARIRKEDKPFDLSPEDMIRLKRAGASDGIVKVMLDPKAEAKAPPPQAAPAAPAQVVVATPLVTGDESGHSWCAGQHPNW